MRNVKSALLALHEELGRLKLLGEDTVFVSDETLRSFKMYFQSSKSLQASKVPSPKVASSPVKKVVVKPVPQSPLPSIPKPEIFELPPGNKEEQWKWLRNRVLNCSVCKENVMPGKQLVFGLGSLNADLFFVGEAPSEEDALVGQPFVGDAGDLLTKILQAMGLEREQVYIGNVLNWKPDAGAGFGNRAPTKEELEFCGPYLKAQIDIVQPKLVVALGATAVNGILGMDKKRKLKDIRGQILEYNGYPLMITYHPAYVLRNGTKKTKRTIWEDLLVVMEKVQMPISDKQKRFFT